MCGSLAFHDVLASVCFMDINMDCGTQRLGFRSAAMVSLGIGRT